jgi:hypothetical protein
VHRWHPLALCLSTLLFVVLLNVLLAAYVKVAPYQRGFWVIKNKWKLVQSTGPVDWLVLGDSSCNQAFHPALWQELTGETALNVCTIGDQALADDLWMLQTYTERNGPPANVLILHAADIWVRGVGNRALGAVPLPWGFWTWHQPRLELSPRDQWDLFLTRYVPIYGQTQFVWERTKDRLREVAASRSLAPLVGHPYIITRAGFMPWGEPDPERVDTDTAWEIGVHAENPDFEPSEVNARALEALVAFADDHGTQVYIVPGPVYRGLAESPEFRTWYGGLVSYVTSFADRSPNLQYHPEPFTFEKGQMENVDHLVGPAADAFTRELAGLLRPPSTP